MPKVAKNCFDLRLIYMGLGRGHYEVVPEMPRCLREERNWRFKNVYNSTVRELALLGNNDTSFALKPRK